MIWFVKCIEFKMYGCMVCFFVFINFILFLGWERNEETDGVDLLDSSNGSRFDNSIEVCGFDSYIRLWIV